MLIEEENTGPWYQHFWPWFLVALLGLSVAGSVWTVNVAIGLGDLSVPAESTHAPATHGRD